MELPKLIELDFGGDKVDISSGCINFKDCDITALYNVTDNDFFHETTSKFAYRS
jgi:hypothetical protein